MGKGGKKRQPSSDESGVSEIGSEEDDATTVVPGDGDPGEPPADPPPSEPGESDSEEEAPKIAEVIKMAEVEVAINMFARTKRGQGALIQAFVVTTKASEGIVKRTMSEWNTIYTKWLKAPR